jgi:hypothetical protein
MPQVVGSAGHDYQQGIMNILGQNLQQLEQFRMAKHEQTFKEMETIVDQRYDGNWRMFIAENNDMFDRYLNTGRGLIENLKRNRLDAAAVVRNMGTTIEDIQYMAEIGLNEGALAWMTQAIQEPTQTPAQGSAPTGPTTFGADLVRPQQTQTQTQTTGTTTTEASTSDGAASSGQTLTEFVRSAPQDEVTEVVVNDIQPAVEETLARIEEPVDEEEFTKRMNDSIRARTADRFVDDELGNEIVLSAWLQQLPGGTTLPGEDGGEEVDVLGLVRKYATDNGLDFSEAMQDVVRQGPAEFVRKMQESGTSSETTGTSSSATNNVTSLGEELTAMRAERRAAGETVGNYNENIATFMRDEIGMQDENFQAYKDYAEENGWVQTNQLESVDNFVRYPRDQVEKMVEEVNSQPAAQVVTGQGSPAETAATQQANVESTVDTAVEEGRAPTENEFSEGTWQLLNSNVGTGTGGMETSEFLQRAYMTPTEREQLTPREQRELEYEQRQFDQLVLTQAGRDTAGNTVFQNTLRQMGISPQQLVTGARELVRTAGGANSYREANAPQNIREQRQLEEITRQFDAQFLQNEEKIRQGWAQLDLQERLAAMGYMSQLALARAQAQGEQGAQLLELAKARQGMMEKMMEPMLENPDQAGETFAKLMNNGFYSDMLNHTNQLWARLLQIPDLASISADFQNYGWFNLRAVDRGSIDAPAYQSITGTGQPIMGGSMWDDEEGAAAVRSRFSGGGQ